jgi:hypothetical protein
LTGGEQQETSGDESQVGGRRRGDSSGLQYRPVPVQLEADFLDELEFGGVESSLVGSVLPCREEQWGRCRTLKRCGAVVALCCTKLSFPRESLAAGSFLYLNSRAQALMGEREMKLRFGLVEIFPLWGTC